MEAEKTFTGTSPSKIRFGAKSILWIGTVWLAFILWSYLESSFIPIIILAVFFALALLMRIPAFRKKIHVRVSGDRLSIHSKGALLWETPLKDITSIDLKESKRTMSATSSKALLIRNNKDDSYFLPLDGIEFEGLEPAGLVEKLNEIKKNA